MSIIDRVSEHKSTDNAKKNIKASFEVLSPGEFDYLAEAKADYYMAGFGKTVIMPKDIGAKPYYITGGRHGTRVTGVLEPLTARAVWIDDNSGRGGVAFVSADLNGLYKYDVDIIRDTLCDFCKVSGCRRVTVCCTGNQRAIDTIGLWGPSACRNIPLKTGRDKEYMDIVIQGIKQAVELAYEDRRAGDLYWGNTEVPGVFVREPGLPDYGSPLLTRLRFIPKDGSKDIYIIHFPYPFFMPDENSAKVSAGFPAFLAQKILNMTGFETVVFTGVAGGTASSYSSGDNPEKTAAQFSQRLADAAMSVGNEKRLEPTVDYISREFYLEVDNRVLSEADMLCIIPPVLVDIKTEKKCTVIKTEMSYFEIGDFRMLVLPGIIDPELIYGSWSAAVPIRERKSGCNPPPLHDIANDSDIVFFGPSDAVGNIAAPGSFTAYSRYFDKNKLSTGSPGPNTAYTVADIFAQIYNKVRKAKGAV